MARVSASSLEIREVAKRVSAPASQRRELARYRHCGMKRALEHVPEKLTLELDPMGGIRFSEADMLKQKAGAEARSGSGRRQDFTRKGLPDVEDQSRQFLRGFSYRTSDPPRDTAHGHDR